MGFRFVATAFDSKFGSFGRISRVFGSGALAVLLVCSELPPSRETQLPFKRDTLAVSSATVSWLAQDSRSALDSWFHRAVGVYHVSGDSLRFSFGELLPRWSEAR